MKSQLLTATIAAVIGFIVACATGQTTPVTAQVTTPDGEQPSETCEWTYIQDPGAPELPSQGGDGEHAKQWDAAGRGGWKLKLYEPHSGVYVFERCHPR